MSGDDRRPVLDGELGADIAAGLLGACVWGLGSVLRAGAFASPLVLVTACGACAGLLGPLGVLVRRARPLPRAALAAIGGAALAAGPVAVAGRLLAERTHHRALGAVTFAVVSMSLWLGASATSLRALTVPADSRWRPLARGFLLTASAASCAALLLFVSASLRVPAFRDGFVDAATGLLSLGLVAAVPRRSLSVGAAGVGALAWLIVVVVAAILFGSSPASRTVLSDRAPVATFWLSGFGGE